MDFPAEAQDRYRLEPGDLIINEGGSYVGRSAMWRGELEECYYQKALHRARPLKYERDTAEFLYFIMEMATQRSVFIAGGNQTTIDHLTAEQLRSYRFPFPPLNEQQAIVSFLEPLIQNFEKLDKKIDQSIDRLAEYRAALVTAAVTGKIASLLTAEAPKPAQRQAPAAFKRAVLAAHIADTLCDHPSFGRVKFQKLLHLCEAHLGVEEVAGHYQRDAAGPFDAQMMQSVHAQIERPGWFIIEKRDGGKGTLYRRGDKVDAYKPHFDRTFGDRRQAIDDLLSLFGPMTTQQAEIVSTTFAAWNDLLLECQTPTDAQIVDLILNDWTDTKRQITPDRWYAALGWMREKRLVPRGVGEHTKKKQQ
jgi:hypothetical protein